MELRRHCFFRVKVYEVCSWVSTLNIDYVLGEKLFILSATPTSKQIHETGKTEDCQLKENNTGISGSRVQPGDPLDGLDKRSPCVAMDPQWSGFEILLLFQRFHGEA